MKGNIIKEIITTLSQFGQVHYRMSKDGVEFYRAGKLFGKLYNDQLYLLYNGQFNNLAQHCIFEFIQKYKASVANDKIPQNYSLR